MVFFTVYTLCYKINKEVIGKFLSFSFLALQFFLVLLFSNYVKLAIPYIFLYLLNGVIGSIMVGMDMFTEGAITGNLTIRWAISIIVVLSHNFH